MYNQDIEEKQEMEPKKVFLKNKYLIICLLVLFGLFYWFQIRPSQIKSYCAEQSKEKAREDLKTKAELDPDNLELQKAISKNMYLKKDLEDYYKYCLQEEGL